MTEYEPAIDIHALRVATDGDPDLQWTLMLAFVDAAERCLSLLAELMAGGDSGIWGGTIRELEAAAAAIHAKRLQKICHSVLNENITRHMLRLGAFMQMKEAYEAVVLSAQHSGLLTGRVQGGF